MIYYFSNQNTSKTTTGSVLIPLENDFMEEESLVDLGNKEPATQIIKFFTLHKKNKKLELEKYQLLMLTD